MPVLSVQMTVAAPIVSVAWILRTRLLVFNIRRIFNAKLRVMLMGSPSGTTTTMRVTATIKASIICFSTSAPNHDVDAKGDVKPVNSDATMYATIANTAPIPAYIPQLFDAKRSSLSVLILNTERVSEIAGNNTFIIMVMAKMIALARVVFCMVVICVASNCTSSL